MLKKSIFLLALISLIAGYSFAQNPTEKKSGDGPKLEIVGGDTYDWGKVTPKDGPLKAKINIKNVGNELLKVTEVKPGCGCTTAPLDKNDIKPGETATLDVTLNIGSASHQLTKTIRISSNDLNDPNKMLMLKCDVFNPIEIKAPNYFAFGEMRVGFESAATAKVKNNTEKDIVLSDFVVTPANTTVNATGPITLKPGQEIEFIAKAKPEQVGYYNCNFKMKTNHPDYLEMTIYGYGNVKESPVFNNK